MQDQLTHRTFRFAKPIGTIGIEASDKGITRIQFGGLGKDSRSPSAKASAHIDSAHQAIEEYLASGRVPKGVRLDLSGTDFRKKIWRALAKVPAGKTLSYGDLALKAGVNPQAARAVGGAMAANPCPILIPCHRVLAANSRLGGFTGGLDRKRALLDHEGARYQENLKASA